MNVYNREKFERLTNKICDAKKMRQKNHAALRAKEIIQLLLPEKSPRDTHSLKGKLERFLKSDSDSLGLNYKSEVYRFHF